MPANTWLTQQLTVNVNLKGTFFTTQAVGRLMIDIGANVGYDTLLASHLVGPTGHVHAIEASPHVFHLLTENLALNQTANVTAHHAAVCASDCQVRVFLHNDSPICTPIYRWLSVSTTVVTLTDVCDLGPP